MHRFCSVGYSLLNPSKVISSQSSSDCINSFLKISPKHTQMAHSFIEGIISPLEQRQNEKGPFYQDKSGSCEVALQEH